MEKYSCFVGIDVSKAKLDVTLLLSPIVPNAPQVHFIVGNDQRGIGQILKELKRKQLAVDTVLFCFEDTGVYSMPLSCFLSEKFWTTGWCQLSKLSGAKVFPEENRTRQILTILHFMQLRICTN